MNILTKEKFLNKVYEKFGNKFSFGKMNYVDRDTEIIIVCPEHGEFVTTPRNFFKKKKGCPKCSMGVMSNKEWISKAKEVHGDRYDYSKVFYKGTHECVTIVCPEHGEFNIVAREHLNGRGCAMCYNKYTRSKDMRLTNKEFIEKAKNVHGDKYDYSKVEYVNNRTKVCIICPEHGEFWQTPNMHLNGQKCPKCSKHFMNTEYFIEKAREVHGNKYDYSKTIYKSGDKKVLITCTEHGDFIQDYYIHLKGCGCPSCKMSHMENEINKFLKEINVNYLYETNIDGLLKRQRVDFYLSDYNIVIECQGGQHFYGGFSRGDIEKEEKIFQNILNRDIRKNKVCKKNNINIVYYTNISDLPIDVLSNKKYCNLYTNENLFTTIESLKQYIICYIKHEKEV